MSVTHHSRGIKVPTYAMRMNDAIGFPCRNPARLLAIAVIARWKEDHERGMRDDLGEEWVELADVPDAWILAAQGATVTLAAL